MASGIARSCRRGPPAQERRSSPREECSPFSGHGRDRSLHRGEEHYIRMLTVRFYPLEKGFRLFANRLGVIGFVVLTALVATPAWSVFAPSAAEFYVLPEHCKAAVSRGLKGDRRRRDDFALMPDAEIARWRQKVGPDFEHLSHYCRGLVLMSRALDPSTARAERRQLLKGAASAIDESRWRSQPGTAIWIEMSLKYGRALSGSGRPEQAEEIYTQGLEQYGGIAEVWTEYAQFLKRRGKLNDAISVLEIGLSKTSKAGPLLFWLAQYYFELGDLEKAAVLADKAEAEGMKMDRLRRRLGQGK